MDALEMLHPMHVQNPVGEGIAKTRFPIVLLRVRMTAIFSSRI